MDSGDTITEFPFLDPEGLKKRLKSRKKSDRIFKSERSEDYVTWNFLQALQRGKPSSWWPELARLARHCSPDSNDAWLVKQVLPKIDVWRKFASPPLYEAERRGRMKESDNEERRERAQKGAPVEGPTEVDAIFKGEEYLIFVEAKLHSRIALKTTHDPERDQIVRNIDCVIEKAGDRRPYFWMFVRDKEKKGDAELIDRYRSSARELAGALPHRDLEQLEQIVASFAVMEWRELMSLLPATPELKDIIVELNRRVA